VTNFLGGMKFAPRKRNISVKQNKKGSS
jgi:hypothetical protein